MRDYALIGHPPSKEAPWGKIEFSTSDGELYGFVSKYMEMIIDAFKWQNNVGRVERPPIYIFQEDEP